jgi:chaperone required for assembly of F1-ATPase
MASLITHLRPRQALQPIFRLSSTSRSIHVTLRHAANPISHPAAPGPPPPAPTVPDEESKEDRVARLKRKVSVLAAAKELKAKQPVTSYGGNPLKKRFWTQTTVKSSDEGHTPHLDTRPLRHPQSKKHLTVPQSKRALALGIALEWDALTSAQQATKGHFIPLTSLTARAFDIEAEDEAHGKENELRKGIVRVMMRYLSTDTLLCWAPETSIHDANDGSALAKEESSGQLRRLQEEMAKPIIAYLTTQIWPGVDINPILEEGSILPIEQPEMTKQVIRGWLMGLAPYDLAGLERAMLATKSLLVGVRLIVEWSGNFSDVREALDTAAKEGATRFGAHEAAKASTLEVAWQTGRWGEVDDTHDVEREDLRRQLGSVVLLVQ